MKVIDRILSKKVVSGDKSAITEETNRSLQQGLLFKEGAIDKRLSIAISRRNRYWQTFVNSEYALKSLLTNVCQ